MALTFNTNTTAVTDGNINTNKNANNNSSVLNVDDELFIAEKHNLLNGNTVEPSTIIEDLIITKTKLSKQEFCYKMKQQCNIRFYDAIKLWKKYNQQLQPEGN
eukprot:208483_1